MCTGTGWQSIMLTGDEEPGPGDEGGGGGAQEECENRCGFYGDCCEWVEPDCFPPQPRDDSGDSCQF